MALSLSITNYTEGRQQPHEAVNQVMVTQDFEINFADEPVAADGPVPIILRAANMRLSKLYHSVRNAEGGTLTYDIGNETTADVYVNGADGNASTKGVVHPTADTIAAAGVITISPKNNADAAVIFVQCEFVRDSGLTS